MEILLISYGEIEFDGRLRSLISVFSEIGAVHSFTRGREPLNELSNVCNANYIRFIGEAIRFANTIGKIDCLVLDNRKATIPGLIIQNKYQTNLTIQDCRELYLFREVQHFTGKMGCIFEKMMARKADIVVCANKERAEIMEREYGLTREPLIYENLRQLKYGIEEELEAAKKKLDPYLYEGEYRIISSSGCSIERTNDVLVQNLPKVKKTCRLFLVGDRTPEEEMTIRKIIEKQSIHNVEILGKLNQTELKYLISKSHIGIVNYGQYDTNNKYCASGKLFEFLYEGKPVVTTSNPPLKRLCDNSNVGVADNEFYNGINTILNNYDYYLDNVTAFVSIHTIEDNDKMLINNILRHINQSKA